MILRMNGSRFLHHNRTGITRKLRSVLSFLVFFSLPLSIIGCAKMGQPDGGWYDETPPRVTGASPADGAVNVNARKINIYFDEFIKIEDTQNKVVFSPPQLETPEIKTTGRGIRVELKDSLKSNTTYTIDFSDAISDNNEGNPLGNYTYSFSTGPQIDTLEVAGYVLEAENLEPIKGILVGLYRDLSDTAFRKKPMLRVSRTDSRGHFVIKGVAPGTYRIYALQDADGDYRFNQKSEKVAFSDERIVPSFRPDVRQDTIWQDSLHIKNIIKVPYTHFLPDHLVFRAFTELLTDRYFLKCERNEADHFTLFFSYGSPTLPVIRGLNFDDQNAFIVEPSAAQDTITYWLRDSSLCNQDTLRLQLQYAMTDSMGGGMDKTDTLEIVCKDTYAKRIKRHQRELEKWQKAQKRAKERGLPYDSVMPPSALKVEVKIPSQMAPDENITFEFPKPLSKLDTAAVHLYSRHDSLWYRAPFVFKKLHDRNFELIGEWRPGIEYSLEIDSAAFRDIYGTVSDKYKQGFKIRSDDEFSSLFVTLTGMVDSAVVVQLLDKSDRVLKQVATNKGMAEFYYLDPGTYYLRMFLDRNRNGKWDTGDYDAHRQPEPVYYDPYAIECRAKWDVTENWNPVGRPLEQQKPETITKQKPDKEKKIKHRNTERARKLGISYPS